MCICMCVSLIGGADGHAEEQVPPDQGRAWPRPYMVLNNIVYA